MTSTTLVAVLGAGRNVPIHEDWLVVPAMRGHQSRFPAWLWSLHNEHRVPLPRLLYLGLLKIWPDFQVGMVFNVAVAAGLSAAFIVMVRRVRGTTRLADAFFPIAFLHLGHWENFGWSWQLQFVVATALACGVLLSMTAPELSLRRAAVLAACLLAIPLTGATAQTFVLVGVVAVALALAARQRGYVVAALAAVGAGALVALNVVQSARPDWARPSPNPWTSITTAAKLLALGFGPGAGLAWIIAVPAAAAAFAVATVVLVRAARVGGLAQPRAVLLLAFLAGAMALVAVVGDSRAGVLATYGIPDRYALLLVPGFCCAYLAWETHGGSAARRWGPRLLCLAVLVALPFNVHYGLQWRDWYHQRVDSFTAAVKAGTPRETLSYDRPLAFERRQMARSMALLRSARVGVFGSLRDKTITPEAGIRIDGFAGTPDAWVTVGGDRVSRVATEPVPDGGNRLLWDYDVRGPVWAGLGRQYGATQDWRGSGAMELTVEGAATSNQIRVRLATTPQGGTAVERYDADFDDDRIGRRTIVIPWGGFEHVDENGEPVRDGAALRLDRVVGVVLLVTDRGDHGGIAVERISLRPGPPPLRWPSHPAAARRSIWPWH